MRGTQLWERLSVIGYGPGHLVLLEEACRTADTLERLDEQLRDGKDWLSLVPDEHDEAELRVVINAPLVERRQQQNTFRLALAELRLAGAAPAGKAPTGTPPAADEGDRDEPQSEGGIGDLVDDNATRDELAERRRSTAG